MSGFTIGPKGGHKNIKDFPLKKWRAECPKCSNIEVDESKNMRCPNCSSPVKMTFRHLFNSQWEGENARRSWRMISCLKECGWSINSVTCSKCGATIAGDFFKGDEPKVVSNCFVATSAFNSANHETVYSLQEWRDTFLQNSAWGRIFIRIYYTIGPFLATILDKFSILKPIVRASLTAFTKILKKSES